MAKRKRTIKLSVKCKGTPRDCRILKKILRDEANRINEVLARGLPIEES